MCVGESVHSHTMSSTVNQSRTAFKGQETKTQDLDENHPFLCYKDYTEATLPSNVCVCVPQESITAFIYALRSFLCVCVYIWIESAQEGYLT